MGWRSLVVDGERLRWTVGVTTLTAGRAVGELVPLVVTLVVRGEDGRRRLPAAFHGVAVEDLWSGRQQSVVLLPRVVAELVRNAPHGEHTVINNAEARFPEAMAPMDPEDAVLAAACRQWFVPYPGRAALAEALVDTDRDFQRVADRFFAPGRGPLTAETVARWVAVLDFRSRALALGL